MGKSKLRKSSAKHALFDQVALLAETEDWSAAYRYLLSLCEEDPDDGGAWELRGLFESQNGNTEAARDCLERASALVPLEEWSSRALAMAYIDTGSRDLGVDLLHTLGKTSHLSSPLGRLLAQDLCRLGAPQLACDVLLDRLEFDPTNAALWHELSAAQTAAGLPLGDAMEAVEQAISLDPEAAEFRVTCAVLLIQLDEPADAYAAACEISERGLERLECPCCLWRLICIFECFDDHPRMARAYERLRESFPGLGIFG